MKGWYGHRQQHSLASKGVRSGKVKQYKPRTSHEFADEFPFWTIEQIKLFEEEFGEILEITSWNTISTEDGEFLVFETEDGAYEWAKDDLINMWDEDKGTFPADWVVEENIYITETDRRIIAGEEADNMIENLDNEEILKMADEYGENSTTEFSELEDAVFDYEEEIEEFEEKQEDFEKDLDSDVELTSKRVEELEANIVWCESSIENLKEEIAEKEKEQDILIENSKDRVQHEHYEEIYDALEDPMEYFVKEQGLYSKEDLLKANFISIDYGGMAESVLDSDGVGHIIARYDGEEHDHEGAYVYRVD